MKVRILIIALAVTVPGIRVHAESLISQLSPEDCQGTSCFYRTLNIRPDQEKQVFCTQINKEGNSFAYAIVKGKRVRLDLVSPADQHDPQIYESLGLKVTLKEKLGEKKSEGGIVSPYSNLIGTLDIKKGKRHESLQIEGECGG